VCGGRDWTACSSCLLNRPMTNRTVTVPGAAEWYIRQQRWPSALMYHYTSREALINILTTRRMWATDLRVMNDPRELTHGRKLIAQRCKATIRRRRNDVVQNFLRGTFTNFRRLIADPSTSFSISFSEHPDLPHQWRDYAADGSGFALGWSMDSPCPEIPLRMWVTYDQGTQKGLIDGLIDFHLSWLRDGVSLHGLEPAEAFAQAGLSLATFFDVALQTFKSNAWSLESESRYVYQFFHGYEPSGQIFKSRFARGVEKRYIEADFTNGELQRVVIGPRNDVGRTTKWLESLLHECGYANTNIVPPLVVL
jgi:hypothetical protein